MATAVTLLFRVYHGLSGDTDFATGSFGSPNSGMSNVRYDLDYNDYIFSVPSSTVDLTEMVNLLVQAEAVLTVGTGIYWVAVFELSPDKPADHMTPVGVYHPFGDWRLLPLSLVPLDKQASVYNDFTGSRVMYNSVIQDPQWGMPFWSYDVWGNQVPRGSYNYLPDRFHVLNIRQETLIGRNRLNFHKLAVTQEDFFWSFRDTLTMRVDSPLYQLRFPMWRQIIKRIKWQHSGYQVLRDGQLEPREPALSYRACGGVTTMNKQRKVVYRRNQSHSYILYLWHLTVRICMSWLIKNEHTGYTKAKLHNPPTRSSLRTWVTAVDYFELQPFIVRIMEFVNTVGMATGNNHLLVSSPGWNPIDRANKYSAIRNIMRFTQPAIYQFSQHPNSYNTRILQQIIRHINYMQRVIRDYKREVIAHNAIVPLTGTTATAIWQAELRAIYNRFAAKWPEIQLQMYHILQALQTWQLTFMPVETTRSTNDIKGMVSRNRYRLREDEHITYSEYREPIRTVPDMSGRFTYDLPQFLPYRFWNFVAVAPDITQLQYNTQQANRADQLRIEQERLRLEAEIKRLELKVKSEAAVANALIEFERDYFVWDDFWADPGNFDWAEYLDGLQSDLSPEQRAFAEGAIDRINKAFDEIADNRAKLNALGQPAVDTIVTTIEVVPPPELSTPDEPYPTVHRWIKTAWEGQQGDFLEWHGDGFIEQTGFKMSDYSDVYQDVQHWPVVDPAYEISAW